MNDTFGDEQFEQFIKLLDAALASNDKKIKTALRKFMFIMALNLSDDDCEPGPFTKMMDTMDELQRRLAILETKDGSWTTGDKWTQLPYGTGTGISPYIAPSTTSGTITMTGTGTGTATQWVSTPSTTAAGSVTTLSGNTTTTATTNTWTSVAGTSSYIIKCNDENIGTEIKDEIKDKLSELAKAA